MPLEEKKYKIETNNDWAKNVKAEHLYIDNAASGRKGYFCIGCDKEMEAVIKRKNPNHRSFFRHVAVDVSKDDTPCTFSNRQYREILATDILQRLKSIKVPNVYKYPPKGVEGAPMLLEKSKFITAKSVKSQLTFYEDGNGEVRYGKNPDVEDRYLLIRPDVIFFDVDDKPILFIELVITHKVTEEKKIKLRRLGVDTISVIIPKSSEQEIEDNFKTSKRVKWEYNGIEAITKYVRVPSGTSEGILEFDEEQRRIFEESVACRKSRLKNTLRTIEKCLQSEPYRRAKHNFESEISRIERATTAEKSGLEDMEARYEKDISTELAADIDAIKSEERRISEAEQKFQRDNSDLEKRYYRKRSKLEQEQAVVSRHIDENFNPGESPETIRRRFQVKELELNAEIRAIEAEIKRVGSEVLELSSRIEKSRELQAERNLEEGKRIEIKRKEIEGEINGFGEYAKEEERKLEFEFKKLGKQAIERINNRDSSGDTELSKRIESVLNAGRLSHGFNERLETYKRYKAYLELARSRAGKK